MAYLAILGVLGTIIFFSVFALATQVPPTTYQDYGSGYAYESSYSGELGVASIVVLILGIIVFVLLAAAMQSAYLGGLLDIANGQPVTIGSFFKPRSIGSVVLATLLISVASLIGSCLIVGSLIVALFAMFTTVIIVDRNASPIDAIKQSIDITKNNIGPVIIAYLVIYAITLVGALLCGVGLIVAMPVASLFLVYVYRKLTNGQVAPLTP